MKMPLTILSDGQVRQLLSGMSLLDLTSMQDALSKALHDCSTRASEEGCQDAAVRQPHRTVLDSEKNGTTTLFMPAAATSCLGVKGRQSIDETYIFPC